MTDMFRIFAGLSMSARILGAVSHPILPTTASTERRSRTYLFHGEAVKIIVLAMTADILIATGIGDMEALRVKAAAETLQQSKSLEAVERASGLLFVRYCSQMTYLTILTDLC